MLFESGKTAFYKFFDRKIYHKMGIKTKKVDRIRQLILANAPAVLKTRPVLLSYLYGSYARENVHLNMPLMMKGKIVTEGMLLFSREDPLRVEFETNVRKAYFDFKPYILRYQKAYLFSAATGT